MPANATATAIAQRDFNFRKAMTPPSRRSSGAVRLDGRRCVAPAGRARNQPSGLALLLDVPEHRRGRDRDAVDVLARRGRLIPLAEEEMRRVLGIALLRRGGDFLLLGWVGLARERIAQLLDLLVAGPA